ncbi:MAG: Uma2 family endonuclease [Algicola sp.]|nr:Uma2 family endonuclease [Algicola sp.]
MTAATKLKLTDQEYLEGETLAEIKHELIDGVAYAMAGTSATHNIISTNVLVEFHQQLKRTPCIPFMADVKVKACGNYFYPDIMIACENDDHGRSSVAGSRMNRSDHEADTEIVKNAPTIIVEVLSKSTRKNDITLKKIAYLNIPSLQEYVLIEQNTCEVEVFRRSENWAATYYVLGDTINFESINVSLSVENIYDRVENDDITAFLAEQSNP